MWWQSNSVMWLLSEGGSGGKVIKGCSLLRKEGCGGKVILGCGCSNAQ